MNQQEPLDFEEWSIGGRAALMSVFVVLVLCVVTGAAVVPALLVVALVFVFGYVVWWFSQEVRENG